MFSISNNELAELPAIGKTVTCWMCGQEHAVEYGETIAEDGTRQPNNLLAFFTCEGSSYLCGVRGKQLKAPKENIYHLDEHNLPISRESDHIADVGKMVPEPVAWAVKWDGYEGIDCEFVYQDEADAAAVAIGQEGAAVVPLYRQPKPALTDAERDAVAWFSRFGRPQNGPVIGKHAAALLGLLERTSGGKR